MTATDLRRGVTVIIPSYNRLDDLRRTVAALYAQTIAPDMLDILLVDNSSTDGTQEWAMDMAAERTNFRYLRQAPQGPALARNAGMREAKREYVLFLDSDVVLTPTWVATATGAIDADPTLGAIGGQVVYAQLPTYLNAFGGALGPIGLGWDFAEGSPVSAASAPRECLWLNCSAMMTWTEAALRLGGFDATFFYGYEDSDFGWRLNLCGYKVAVLPTLVALHHVYTPIGPSNPTFVFHYTKNRIRSLLKNYEAPRALGYGMASILITLVDGVLRAPRMPKLHAVAWNAARLPETLRERSLIQKHRTQSDAELVPLFSRSWFPPTRLSGNQRRPVAGLPAAASPLGPLRDDRVH